MFSPNCLILTLAPEICLKSNQVRIFYEKFLKKNIVEYLKFDGLSYSQIIVRGGRIYIFSEEVEKVQKSLENCFGIHKFSLAQENEIKDLDELVGIGSNLAVENLKETFAVRAKSYDKDIKSKRIEELMGAAILKSKPGLKVNLSEPKSQINCILIRKKAYFYFEEIEGAKGMPIGTQGVAVIIGENENEIKRIAFSLLKTGARVRVVEKEIKGLEKWNNKRELKSISLKEAKELYADERIRAFFSDANSLVESKKHSDLVGEKVIAPLLCVRTKTPFDRH